LGGAEDEARRAEDATRGGKVFDRLRALHSAARHFVHNYALYATAE
jgi:hypothetical protein